MARNIELKFRYSSLDVAARIAQEICAVEEGVEKQTDTYFTIAGEPAERPVRLKLRRRHLISPDERILESQLIHYHRPTTCLARASDYELVQVSPPDAMLAILDKVFERLVEVRKTRTIYTWNNVRIHLDCIANLGSFVEFEAIVDSECNDVDAHSKVNQLIQAFTIDSSQLVSSSYSDLLLDGLRKEKE